MKFLPFLAALLFAPDLFAQSTPRPAATLPPGTAMPMCRTTHQRTIEYGFGDNEDTLMNRFDSAESAFRRNKNTVVHAQ